MLKKWGILILTFCGFIAPIKAFALSEGGIAQDAALESFLVGQSADLTTNNGEELFSIISTIINATFGLLGIIAVLLIVYAGFLWVSAAGADEQVKKAKQIIRGTVIATILLSISFAIVRFVIGVSIITK